MVISARLNAINHYLTQVLPSSCSSSSYTTVSCVSVCLSSCDFVVQLSQAWRYLVLQLWRFLLASHRTFCLHDSFIVRRFYISLSCSLSSYTYFYTLYRVGNQHPCCFARLHLSPSSLRPRRL